jgi:hypothetical protein
MRFGFNFNEEDVLVHWCDFCFSLLISPDLEPLFSEASAFVYGAGYVFF